MALNIIVTSANFKDLLGPVCVFGAPQFVYSIFFPLPYSLTLNKAFPYILRKRESVGSGCMPVPCDSLFRSPSEALGKARFRIWGLTGNSCRLQIRLGKSGEPEHHGKGSHGCVAQSVAGADTGLSQHSMASMRPHSRWK